MTGNGLGSSRVLGRGSGGGTSGVTRRGPNSTGRRGGKQGTSGTMGGGLGTLRVIGNDLGALGVMGCPSAVKYSVDGPGDAVIYSDSLVATKLGVLDSSMKYSMLL